MWPPQQALFRKQLRRGRLAQLSNPKVFLSLFPVQFRHFLLFFSYYYSLQFILVITGKLIRNLAQTKWSSPLLCLTSTSQHDAWSRDHRLLRTTKAPQTLRSQLLADFSKCTQTSKFSPNDTTERYLHGVWEKQNGIQFCSPGPDLVGNVFATQFKFFFSRTFEHDL